MNAALHPTIAQLQNSSLTTVVQQEIERAILAGEYEPGSKLIEATLAEKMGVSRGPVREAFRMLEEAGLVRTEKNRGVFVRDIPIDEAIEIFDLRAAMDELVGRRLAEPSKSLTCARPWMNWWAGAWRRTSRSPRSRSSRPLSIPWRKRSRPKTRMPITC